MTYTVHCTVYSVHNGNYMRASITQVVHYNDKLYTQYRYTLQYTLCTVMSVKCICIVYIYSITIRLTKINGTRALRFDEGRTKKHLIIPFIIMCIIYTQNYKDCTKNYAVYTIHSTQYTGHMKPL